MHRSKKNKKSGSNRGHKQNNRNKSNTKNNLEENGDVKNDPCECIVDEIKEQASSPSFSVKTSEIMGRYLVSEKDIHAGELILNEEAIVVGPCQGSKPLCLICYRSLVQTGESLTPINTPVPCESCGWPLCGVESCIRTRKDPTIHHDHRDECRVFAAARKNKSFSQDPLINHSLYEAIVPLRSLLYKTTSPERWQEICRMESHDAIRKTRPIIWNTNQELVVDIIRGPWRLADRFSEEEIHRVCGALEVNAFEIGRNDSSLRALFGPYSYLIAHDCVPNTSHVDVFKTLSKGKGEKNIEAGVFRLNIRTSTPVAKGQPFYLSYAHTLQGTAARREHVRESKFFSCECQRCKDPTELGTYLSALQCPKCVDTESGGKVISTNPLDECAEWRCVTCGCFTLDPSSIKTLLKRISEEAASLSSGDVDENEAFLKRYRNILHPSHYLAVGVKHALSQIYGKKAGYTIHELPRTFLERKRELCRELLKIFDVIEPGKTKLRGITLYELHAPLMTMITRDLEEGRLNAKRDKKELKRKLLEVCQYLEESRDILLNEPPYTSEALMASAAGEALKELRKWISTL